MDDSNQNGNRSKAADARLKQCWWMQAGVVDYKLCDLDYDCERCTFDEGLHGRATTLPHASVFSGVGSSERDRKVNIRKGSREAAGLSGSEVASAIFYHPAHIWARIEDGGCVRSGLDDFALRILGRPYLVTLPEPGATLRFGEGCWQFTHQAGVAVLVAPVSGRVKEINPALAARPTLLNRDPYGAGWALLIEPTDLKGCLQRLLYGPKARQWYERECEKLNERISELTTPSGSTGATMNDGGSLRKDFRKELAADQLRQVVDYFFPLSLNEKAETNKAILVKHGGVSW